MIVQYVSYVAALRLLFFGNRPATAMSKTRSRVGGDPAKFHPELYVYDPAQVPEAAPAVDEARSWALDVHPTWPPPDWDPHTRNCAKACGAFLRSGLARIIAKYPLDRVLVAGLATAEQGDSADHFDPAMRLHVDPGEASILELPEPVKAAHEWRDWSAQRTSQLTQIWQMDVRDDGPHQPWARAKGKFMLALAALGVRPPALELLPTWNVEWWYEAVGYEQTPAASPRPVRCWGFPRYMYNDATPRVCGRALATLGAGDLSTCGGADDTECQAKWRGLEITGDDDRQTVTEKRRRARSDLPTVAAMREGVTRSMTPEDMDLARSTTPETRALAAKVGAVAPYGDCLAPRERTLVALLGHVGIGGTERVEILNRCAAALEKHERAWKLAVSDDKTEALPTVVSELAFDAAFLAYALRRILAP